MTGRFQQFQPTLVDGQRPKTFSLATPHAQREDPAIHGAAQARCMSVNTAPAFHQVNTTSVRLVGQHVLAGKVRVWLDLKQADIVVSRVKTYRVPLTTQGAAITRHVPGRKGEFSVFQ